MRTLLLVAAFALLGTAATAQTTETSAAEAKEHVCSAACTAEVHAYAHGEKGHTCAEACKTASEAKTPACCAGKKEGEACKKHEGKAEAKGKKGEHACTEACANGQHAYDHGEKGHKCDKSCK